MQAAGSAAAEQKDQLLAEAELARQAADEAKTEALKWTKVGHPITCEVFILVPILKHSEHNPYTILTCLLYQIAEEAQQKAASEMEASGRAVEEREAAEREAAEAEEAAEAAAAAAAEPEPSSEDTAA